MAMTFNFGQSMCLRMLKWVSLVTMYSASAATAQSTNLLSSTSQPEVVIDFQKLRCVKPGDGLDHVASNFGIGFLANDFLVLAQNVGIYAQADVSGKNLSPYLVIRTETGQSLQQAVGVKDDASHRCKVCACVLRPIAQWSVR